MVVNKITGIFNEKDPYDISDGTVHFTGEETGDIKSGQKLGDIIGRLNKAVTASTLPVGGYTGQALVKRSDATGDVVWGSILPVGGSTGDFLRKGADGPVWETVPFAEQSSF